MSCEVNFDGLVGPTHHYAGLAFGNLASIGHQGAVSNPRQAALQGLEKMRWLMDRGFIQGVLPPQLRPNFSVLRQLGFQGSLQAILTQVWQQSPHLLSMCSSASAMWVANAATVIPACDNESQRTVLVPANLLSHFHRSIEAAATTSLLRYVFADRNYFQVTAPLPAVAAYADEGAANHMRIALPRQAALHVFVYGNDANGGRTPSRYPSRQTREASAAIARLGGLAEQQVMLVKQNPEAIDAGVFHNDVIALSHDGLLLCHQQAFLNQPQVLDEVRSRSGDQVTIVQVPEADVSLQQAVSSYLFNSQILGGAAHRVLLLPVECEQDAAVKRYVESELRQQLALQEIAYVDLQQSMRNGGGPACLRLRVNLDKAALRALKGRLILDDELHEQLVALVQKEYPERLTLEQLADWQFTRQVMETTRNLYRLLDLPLALLDASL
ncbi:MAG: N-succinylarginine dihydrolase [Pseudomonadota bacterium]|nr:N-succinylarginine dihydrolase [Pseudomonadota bacterium]